MIERLTNQLVQDGISTITLYAEPQVCVATAYGDPGRRVRQQCSHCRSARGGEEARVRGCGCNCMQTNRMQ